MGISRFAEEEAIVCCFDAGAVSVPARAMVSLIPAPPGTAAANRPPPVAARNCLRSTDLLPCELRMPNPQKCPSHPAQITTRGIIRLLSGRGSHKIVLVDMNCGKFIESKAGTRIRAASGAQSQDCLG